MRGRFFDTPQFQLYLQYSGEGEPEAFVRKGLTASLGWIQSMLSQLPDDQAEKLFGGRRSQIRIGLQKLAKRESVWQDLLDEETRRIRLINDRIREASQDSLARMPDRQRELREYAESALCEGSKAATEKAQDAITELLDQPIGRRDAFTQMLNGWLQHFNGDLESAKSAFTQACLCSEGVLFDEASRLLATVQVSLGDIDGALKTLHRVNFPDFAMQYETLKLVVLNDRVTESQELLQSLIPVWPVAILGLYSDQAVLAKAADWRPTLEQVATQMQFAARESTLHWSRSIEEATRTLRLVDTGLELPVGRLKELEVAKKYAAISDVFVAQWVSTEAQRGMANVSGAARSVLRGALRSLQDTSLRAERELASMREWKDERIRNLQATPAGVPPDPPSLHQRVVWIGLAVIVSVGLTFLMPWFMAAMPVVLALASTLVVRHNHVRALATFERREVERQEAIASEIQALESAYFEDAAEFLQIAQNARRRIQQADASIELFDNWPSDFRIAA